MITYCSHMTTIFLYIMTPIRVFGVSESFGYFLFSFFQSWWKRLSPERKKAVWAAVSKRRKYLYGSVGLLCLGGTGYYYSHLETTPITGRYTHTPTLHVVLFTWPN